MLAVLFLLPLVAGCSDPEPAERFSKTAPVLAEDGAILFGRYCASCHGPDGRGGGPVTVVLRDRPADLTSIAARRDGVFPSAEIRHHIDGRIANPSHGSREMPVWGQRFNQQLAGSAVADELARGRLVALVDYLQSIQDPPPSKVE